MIKTAYFRGLAKAAQSADEIANAKSRVAKILEIVNAKPKADPTSMPPSRRPHVLSNILARESIMAIPMSIPPQPKPQQPLPPLNPAQILQQPQPRFLPSRPQPVPAPYNKKS